MNEYEHINNGIGLLFCVAFPAVILVMAVLYMLRKPDADAKPPAPPPPDGVEQPANADPPPAGTDPPPIPERKDAP